LPSPLSKGLCACDRCWFCKDHDRITHKMTRSHVFLNCRNPRLAAARAEAWEGKKPGNVRRLLADPRWEKRFVRFLELSGVGRTVEDGTDEESAYAERMIRGLRGKRRKRRRIGYPPRGTAKLFLPFSTCSFPFVVGFVGGAPAPEDLRTAHLWKSVDIGVLRGLSFVCVALGTYPFGMTPCVLSRESNK
jgi:hypothetical protein